jgi:predicted acylesterase/phospholipase RssA
MRFELAKSGLTTIPMAVTASSAFPGFFPPLQLTAADVGADESRFPPHLFTDGGVYDNLGVRMFRHHTLYTVAALVVVVAGTWSSRRRSVSLQAASWSCSCWSSASITH